MKVSHFDVHKLLSCQARYTLGEDDIMDDMEHKMTRPQDSQKPTEAGWTT